MKTLFLILFSLLIASCAAKAQVEIDVMPVHRDSLISYTINFRGLDTNDVLGKYEMAPGEKVPLPQTDLGVFAIKISADGYRSITDTIITQNQDTLEYRLQELSEGTLLETIYFGINSTHLSPRARKDLEGMVSFLNENPNLGLLIEGHSGLGGRLEKRQKLSEKRAKKVQKWLSRKGIANKRLKTAAYGSTQSQYVEGHRKNRKVTLIIF